MVLTRGSSLALASLLTTGFAAAQLQLLAHYPLQSDLLEATAAFGPMVLYGTTPPSPPANGLCFNGIYLFSGGTGGQDARTPLMPTLNTSDFQFSVEFQITALGPNNRPVLMGGNSYRWLGIYTQANGTIGLKHNNSNLAWSTTTVSPGTWYTGTVKYENGTVELYLDGALVQQTTVGPLNTSTNLNFCTNDYSNGAAFYGCIRNLRVYNDTTLGTTAATYAYGSGCDGLTLGANGDPTLGNALFELAAANVPVTSPVAFFAFGSGAVNPGVDLGVIGMAGCFSHTSFDLGLYGPAVVLGGTAALPLPIPNDPALTGSAFASQAVSFTPTTALGLATSNGLRIVLAP